MSPSSRHPVPSPPRDEAAPGLEDCLEDCGDGATLPGCRPADEERLVAEGWQARFVADPRMAREALESYRALGYEVKMLPLASDPEGAIAAEACRECLLVAREFRKIYTRRREAPG